MQCRTSRRAPSVVCVLVLTVLVAASLERAEAAEARLPGARPVVEAIHYPSLQQALDGLPPEGGEVRIPPGTFVINEPLVIEHEKDVLLRGSGTATHIKNENTSGEPSIVIRPGPPQDGEDTEPQWRVHLADFRVTGNEESGHGIVARRVNEIYIEGVSVSHNGGDGILLDHCYEDPRVCNSLITYNGGAGLNLVSCHDIVVSANQFEENRDAVRCIDGYNLCMTGNNIDDHLRHGVVIENTYGSVVSGNMIEECNGTAILLDRDCYGDTLKIGRAHV